MMDPYKDYLQCLRKLIYNDIAYILIGDLDVTTNLTNYVFLLNEVKFEDGAYHTFYGEVKKIIKSFLKCYSTCVDDVIKDADKCSQIKSKTELLELVERTISTHHADHVTFGRNFLPIKGDKERELYDDIQKKFEEFIEKHNLLRTSIEKMGKQNQIDEFVAEHFQIAVTKTSEIFEFTHTFLAMMLADRLYQIRVSLEEIHLRLNNNLMKIQNECDSSLNDLLHRLYDKNKESIHAFRREKKSSLETVEITRGIDSIRRKISNFEEEHRSTRLEEEVAYWTEKIKEFNLISNNVSKLKTAQEAVIRDENIYKSYRSADLPGSKYCCWINMGENFTKRKEYLNNKIIEAAKCLVTFFAVRGCDRIVYTDNIGPHYIDEYKHRIYITDHGLGNYHINCEGDFKETDENAYYYDTFGRYILKDGAKVYQVSPCTSLHQLNEYDVMEKITKDCGHSEKYNKACKMDIKNPHDVQILPDNEPMDIKGTLDAETANYLWDNFGIILSNALCDVESAKPKNPIHYLAHRLLYHKYNKTKAEQQKLIRDSAKYRFDIYKERKQKAVKASLDWRSKNVQRRKPEESDDSYERSIYDAHLANNQFINALNNC